jgi:hypothetical protein
MEKTKDAWYAEDTLGKKKLDKTIIDVDYYR